MKFLDEIKLGFGHNLVIGNLPKKINLTQLSEIIKQENHQMVEKFGFFENSTPNYTTYYPDVTAEDLAPKEDDFIEPVFRALSEVIVHKGYNPVDFSMNGVLRKSLNKLAGQTINVDHETATGNAIGAVSDVSWQDSYKSSGVLVPAGINAKLKIDGKSNPRLARGIMMDPPSIHSTSVTVQFMWERSHAAMEENEFFSKLGQFDKDGQMIRRVATDIKMYKEISLVGHGADPFAMKIGKDGVIVNPKYAGLVYNSEKERTQAQIEYNKKQRYFFYDTRTELLSNSENDTIPDDSNEEELTEQKNTDMNLKQMALALGLAETATEAEVLAALTALQNAKTTADAEVTRLKAAQPDAAKLTELQAFKDAATTAKQTHVLALYNKSTKTPDEKVTALIAKADLGTLEVLESQYASTVDKLYPATCKKCGGNEITRASAMVEDEGGEEKLAEESGIEKLKRLKKAENLGFPDSAAKKVETAK